MCRCHPRYLDVKAHSKLSRSGAFDGLRIHTDEINEVIARITPSTLSIAVVSHMFCSYQCSLIVQLMDSMDWFDPTVDATVVQVRALNKVMKDGGRILFRSAALRPWYTQVFEENGFSCACVGKRIPGACIDR